MDFEQQCTGTQQIRPVLIAWFLLSIMDVSAEFIWLMSKQPLASQRASNLACAVAGVDKLEDNVVGVLDVGSLMLL